MPDVDLAVIMTDGDYLKREGDALVGAPPMSGPVGPTGPAGEKGDPGEPGGAMLSAFWQYASTTTAPPASGQMRTDSPITTLWVSETDTDGYDRSAGLATIASGDAILVRAANGTAMDLQVTGTPTDAGTYRTFPVTVTSGTVTKGARTQLSILASAGLYAPIRRTLVANTGTFYTPALTDENKMVTLSNASAITVTLPTNATVAFPVGAEVDWLWLGAGQPTFVAEGGATANGTPGLKLRAQYSAATSKKVGTNAWVLIGDVAS